MSSDDSSSSPGGGQVRNYTNMYKESSRKDPDHRQTLR